MIQRIRTVALTAALIGTLGYLPQAAAAEPVLPDLGMAKLTDLKITITPAGQVQLRFSATIVNVGRGPFELHARRSAGQPWDVKQRVYNSPTGYSESAAPVELVYSGDGHNHWHIKDLEVYELKRLDNGVKVGTGSKGGFCFFDNTSYRTSLPGAPQGSYYWSQQDLCGGHSVPDADTVLMGLSVGWGDEYHSRLPDQYIDITGLSNGKYRLLATADPLGRFAEVNNGNNFTWVDINLSTKRGLPWVKAIGYGPTA